MTKFVRMNLTQLVATLDNCIKSCVEEENDLRAKLDENYHQRVSYVENKLLAEALLKDLEPKAGEPSVVGVAGVSATGRPWRRDEDKTK